MDGIGRLLKAAEVAAVLGVSRSKAYELMEARSIPTIKIGASIRSPEARLREWLDARIEHAAPDCEE